MEEVSENCWLWKTPFWNEPVLFVSSKCLEKGKWFLSMAWHSFSSRMHSFWMVESFRESRNFRKNHNLCILLVNKLAQVPMPKYISANIAQMKRCRCYWNFHLGIKSFFFSFSLTSQQIWSFVIEIPALQIFILPSSMPILKDSCFYFPMKPAFQESHFQNSY